MSKQVEAAIASEKSLIWGKGFPPEIEAQGAEAMTRFLEKQIKDAMKGWEFIYNPDSTHGAHPIGVYARLKRKKRKHGRSV